MFSEVQEPDSMKSIKVSKGIWHKEKRRKKPIPGKQTVLEWYTVYIKGMIL